MLRRFSAEQWLGLLVAAAALLIIFVWVPLDVESGIVDRVRRRLVIGDSLGPTVAGVVLLIGGVLTLASPTQGAPNLTRMHVYWVVGLLVLFAVTMSVMRYAGPLIIGAEPYRALRITPPYSYVGYILGGTIMIGTMVSLVRRSISWRGILIGFLASLMIALLYDLPFDDLLLPPNGDV